MVKMGSNCPVSIGARCTHDNMTTSVNTLVMRLKNPSVYATATASESKWKPHSMAG